ncbi:MAG: hypothetical protein AAGA33_11950, partial [Pseudomonadota bacterium]
MKWLAVLAAGGLLSLPTAAADMPVRDWPSPGLEVAASRESISLRGHIASTSHLFELNESSGRKQLTAEQTYKHVLLPDHWRATSTLLVTLLDELHSGDAAMTRDDIVLRGTLADTATSEAIETRLRNSVPPTTTVTVDVWRAPSADGACEALLVALLEQSFRLRAGSVSVSGEHFPRLNRIAD